MGDFAKGMKNRCSEHMIEELTSTHKITQESFNIYWTIRCFIRIIYRDLFKEVSTISNVKRYRSYNRGYYQQMV